MIVPHGRINFPGEQWTSPKGRPKFLKETYVSNLLAIIIISKKIYIDCDLSLERFRRELQFCDWKYFNQNLHAKIMFTQSFGHGCSPRENGLSCSPGEHGLGCSSRELRAIPLGNNLNRVPPKSKCATNFVCAYVSFDWHVYNYKIVTLLETFPLNITSLYKNKYEVHYFSRKLALRREQSCPQGKLT